MTSNRPMQASLNQIKTLCQKKGSITEYPENSSEVLVILESKNTEDVSASIAVGKTVFRGGYYEVQGKVLEDKYKTFNDSFIKIVPSANQKVENDNIFVARFAPGLIRSIDEATWNNNFNGIGDLIRLLEKLDDSQKIELDEGPNESF